MKRALLMMGMAALSCASFAQVSAQSQQYVLSGSGNSWTFNYLYFPSIGVGGGWDEKPVSTNHVTVSLAGSNLWDVAVEQTHLYVSDGAGGGEFVARTAAVNAWQSGGVSGTTASQTNALNSMYGDIARYLASNSDITLRTGRYRITWRIKTSGGTTIVSATRNFEITKWAMFYDSTSESGGGSGSGSTGTGAQDPDVDVQKGFWESLFVPDEECLDGVKDAATAFTEWGPLGLFNQMVAALDTDEDQMAASVTKELNITGEPNSGSDITFDTSPWDGALGIFRGLLAGVIWFGGIWAGWKIAQKVMG